VLSTSSPSAPIVASPVITRVMTTRKLSTIEVLTPGILITVGEEQVLFLDIPTEIL
jgi:hypothetical protein